MKAHHLRRRVAAALSCALLAGSSLPAAQIAPAPALAAEPAPSWVADIPAMLERPHVEHQAIAAVYGSPGAPGALATQSAGPLATAEPLMKVSATSALEAAGDARPLATASTSGAEDVTLALVSDDTLTTEEILIQLAADATIAWAEPNYTYDAAELPAEDLADALPLVVQSAGSLAQAEDLADLTPLQYAYTNATSTRYPGNYTPSASVNPPSWGATGSNMDNEVVVALVDSFADYNHPDLQGVIYEFSAEQQEALNCGRWGVNAVADESPTAYKPGNHGTACASLMAANWNGMGMSGAGSKIKIVNIRNLFDNHDPDDQAKYARDHYTVTSWFKAYDFIDRACASGVPIRIVSNSAIPLSSTSRAVDAAIRSVGEKYGVVTLIAAGNDGLDHDQLASNFYGTNPYAIVVTATTPKDELFSTADSGVDYGARTVDLAVPGTCLLHAVPLAEATYLPFATIDSNLLYEDFEGGTFKARFLGADGKAFAARQTSGNEPRLTGAHAIDLPLAGVSANSLGETGWKSQDFRLVLDASGVTIPQDGAKLGASFQADVPVAVLGWRLIMPDGSVVETPATDDVFHSGDGAWGTKAIDLPAGCIHDDGTIVVDLTLWTINQMDPSYNGLDHLYIDALGIGTQLSAYNISWGTSWATPLAAGCVAVMASSHPELKGADLAAYARGSVRKNASLAGKTLTGGVIDLSATNVTPLYRPASAASAAGTWERALSLDASTGAPYALDAPGDNSTEGPLAALGGKLYYLPAVFNAADSNEVADAMYVFDVAQGEWASEPVALPEALGFPSAAAYDGKLYVKGAECEQAVKGVYNIAWSGARVYAYDPKSGAWTKLSAEGVASGQEAVLAATADGLVMVNGGWTDDEGRPHTGSLQTYSPAKGVGDGVQLSGLYTRPRIASVGSDVYVIDNDLGAFERVRGGKATDLSSALPSGLVTAQEKKANVEGKTVYGGRNATLVEGEGSLYLVGPIDAANRTDTWVLEGDAFKPYGKRLSNEPVLQGTAAYADGALYAIAGSAFEKNNRVFRATRLSGEWPDEPADPDAIPETDPDLEHAWAGYQHWVDLGDGTPEGSRWVVYDEGHALMRNAWVNYSYHDASGAYRVSVDDWYWLGETGEMLSGWHDLAFLGRTDTYHFNEAHDGSFGKMHIGWKQLGGAWYYFRGEGEYPKGALVRSAWVGASWVGDDGAWRG